jgi:hypothetical protein
MWTSEMFLGIFIRADGSGAAATRRRQVGGLDKA